VFIHSHEIRRMPSGPPDESRAIHAKAILMGLFKPDFYRFFALGFGAGALLVAATVGIRGGDDLSGGMVPSAAAAPASE
jgi:hypothetical protein